MLPPQLPRACPSTACDSRTSWRAGRHSSKHGDGERLALSVAQRQDVCRLPRNERMHLVAALVHVLERAHQIGVAHRGGTIDVVRSGAETLACVACDLVVAKPPGHVGRLQLD